MRVLPSSTCVAIWLLLSTNAYANCECACVNGQIEAVCTSAQGIKPFCPPKICAYTPPSIAPVQQPRVPPMGTSECVQKQVYNTYTHVYEWQEVCN
jgi:hypothetical protein